jgi:hypothetical protein
VRAFLTRHLGADGGVLIFGADHAFATKPALALAQAQRALAAGITPAWATGDEVYGRSRKLREFCEAAGIGYVFAVPVDHQFTTSGQVRMRADQALGLDRHRPPTPMAADPPLHQRSKRAGVLLRLRARAPCLLDDRPGQDRRGEMEGGGRLPGLEIHRLARPDPGQALPGVETPRHHGHGGPRPARRDRGHRQDQPPRPHPARRSRPGPAGRWPSRSSGASGKRPAGHASSGKAAKSRLVFLYHPIPARGCFHLSFISFKAPWCSSSPSATISCKCLSCTFMTSSAVFP